MNKLLIFFRLLYLKNFSRQYADEVSFILAEKIFNLFYKKYIFSEYGRIWMNDENFFNYYKKFQNNNNHSADRKFFLRSLLSLIEDIPGDTAECGVLMGASSWLICEHFKDSEKIHHAFDSFEGLSMPLEVDGLYWKKGDLHVNEEIVKKNLEPYKVKFFPGWIPQRFEEVSDRKFCFVHIDVDLYDPTLESLSFFYPRLVAGGIILCDDYGFITCPGAKKAFDEYMKDKAEKIIHVPTGQGFIIKK